MSGYAPLAGRLKAVVIVFALITVTWIVSVVFWAMDIAMLDRVIAGEEVSNAEWIASDERIVVIGRVQLLGWVLGACAFITWLYRAYQNVDAVAPSQRRFGHGWAIGSWFVPILNLWRPKQIVNDIWRAGGTSKASVLAWCWWTSLLLSNVVGRAGDDYTTSEDLTEVRDSAITLLVSDALGLIAAVCVRALTIRWTRRLDDAADRSQHPPDEAWRLFPPQDDAPRFERKEDGAFPAYPG